MRLPRCKNPGSYAMIGYVSIKSSLKLRALRPKTPMAQSPSSSSSQSWFGHNVAPGESVNAELLITESYSSRDVGISLRVIRGLGEGPTVFVSGALHGDEINGTGAIRSLIAQGDLQLTSGTLVLIPVLNVLGFERHSRYLPDRRDLNRWAYPTSAPP